MAIQTTDKADALKRLRLFNEKAQELQSYSFIDKAGQKDAGVTVHFDFEKKTVEATRVGADKEARAALNSVIRFFLQKRDRIELHQIAELYQELPVSSEEKQLVSASLADLDSFLDGATELAFDGTPITYRAILETFLYGDEVHANEDKRAIFEKWKEVGAIHLVLENFFEYTLCEVVRVVLWLAAMNVEAIRTMEQTIPPS